VGMASASTRLSNSRLKQEFGLTLRYPDFHDWLDERLGDALVAEAHITAV